MHTKKTLRRAALISPMVAGALLLAGCGLGEPDRTVAPVRPEESTSQTKTQSEAAETPQPESSEQPAPSGTDESAQTDPAPGSALPGVEISPQQAARTALEAHPDSQVIEISLDRVRGVTAWEVEVLSENAKWEVSVDAVTGQVVLEEQSHSSSPAKYMGRLADAQIDYAKAIELMLAAVPGGSIVEIELDDHHGRVSWEGDVIAPNHAKHEIIIDGITGDILENEIDD